MNLGDLIGTWRLAGVASLAPDQGDWADLDELDDLLDAWRRGEPDPAEDFPIADPARGLTLRISADGTLTEHLDAPTGQQPFFAAAALAVGTDFPVAGRLRFVDGLAFVVTDQDEATPLDDEDGELAAWVRYTDPDTTITDRILIDQDGELCREISIVTDDLYRSRVLLIYRR